MDELNNQNSDDFSNDFKPRWKIIKFWYSIMIPSGIALCFSIFYISIPFKVAEFILGSLIILSIVVVWIYFFWFLNCPRCDKNILFPTGFLNWQFFLTGECPHCGAILKKRFIKKESQEKTIIKIQIIAFITFFTVILVMVIIAILTGRISLR